MYVLGTIISPYGLVGGLKEASVRRVPRARWPGGLWSESRIGTASGRAPRWLERRSVGRRAAGRDARPLLGGGAIGGPRVAD
jgi:hypothetical protein